VSAGWSLPERLGKSCRRCGVSVTSVLILILILIILILSLVSVGVVGYFTS
jgi:nitrate reductase NapE component